MTWLSIIVAAGLLTGILLAFKQGEKTGRKDETLRIIEDQVEGQQKENDSRHVIQDEYNKIKGGMPNSYLELRRLRQKADNKQKP